MQRNLLFFALLTVFLTLFFTVSQSVYAQTRDTHCHTIQTVGDVPSGYASPINLFGNSFLMKTLCNTDGSVVAEVGDGSQNQYIYKYGYQRVNGEWKRITYSGSNRNGPWIIGTALANITPQGEQTEGKFIAYICQKVDGRWKCGCSDTTCSKAKWQVQTYDTETVTTTTIPPQTETDSGSYNTGALMGMFGFEDSDELALHYPSKYVAEPGETVRLTGSGYGTEDDIDVLWNGRVAQENLRSENGWTLDIQVPDWETGKYRVNIRKDGEEPEYDTVIWIGTGKQDPVITSVTPNTIDQGDTITIHGTGFDQNNNDVLTSLNEYTEVESDDGETITITFDPYEERRKMYNMDAEHVEYEELVYVKVVNTAGVSNDVTFYLAYD